MKNRIYLAALLLGLNVVPVHAQIGGGPSGPQGPQFNGGMAKLFGDNNAFSSQLEMQIQQDKQSISTPGRMAYDTTKSRFEMDMSQMKNAMVTPAMIAQMRALGMDKMTIISRPDKKMTYMVYPNMKAYAEVATDDADVARPAADFKIETTELGKETVEGHPCVKNKSVVTGPKGDKQEFTVWNATDLKKFPVKIESSEGGITTTMVFKEVKLTKPEASEFDPPADMKRYESPNALIQGEVMKRFNSGGGMPPQAP